jgi:hypothetical protein
VPASVAEGVAKTNQPDPALKWKSECGMVGPHITKK